jgi:hypothetical protein
MPITVNITGPADDPTFATIRNITSKAQARPGLVNTTREDITKLALVWGFHFLAQLYGLKLDVQTLSQQLGVTLTAAPSCDPGGPPITICHEG